MRASLDAKPISSCIIKTRIMFEPNEESLVLEIVRGFFDIPSEEMMKIGDQFKMLLFDPQAGSEQEAVAKLKEALADMSKEQVLMAGMFVSGLSALQPCRAGRAAVSTSYGRRKYRLQL